jgi:hypothetical protein
VVDGDLLRRELAERDEHVAQISESRDVPVIDTTGVRNIAVPECARIDADLVAHTLRQHLGDFGRFKSAALGGL